MPNLDSTFSTCLRNSKSMLNRLEKSIMSSIPSPIQQNTALDRMNYSTLGLHGLPTEIWQYIFRIAGDPLDYFNRVDPQFGVASNWFFSDKTEATIRDYGDWAYPFLFRTRLSIILVCKSWYFMGIRLLWSHLRVRERDDRGFVSTIYQSLKQNPAIASYIIRLTIVPLTVRRSDNFSTKEDTPIVQIVPLLPNLTTISCSSLLAARLPSSLPILSAIIHNVSSSATQNSLWYNNIPIKPYFWHHCHTLSFVLTKDQWRGQANPQHQYTFHNLVNLRLCMPAPSAISWILGCWEFPVLKNLSIVSNNHRGWIPFIKSVRLTIESLQVPSHIDYAMETDTLEMPKLKELHIIDEFRNYLTPGRLWNHVYGIPKLQKFVYYAKNTPIASHRLLQDGFNDFLKLFMTDPRPSLLREVEIITDSSEVPHNPDRPPLRETMAYIALWCSQGLTAVLIRAEDGCMRKYTKGSFSDEEMAAWGRYRAENIRTNRLRVSS